MTNDYSETPLDRLAQALRAASLVALAGLALALTGATALAAFRLIPWPDMALRFGETTLTSAGMWVQIGLTIFALALLAFLPANRQMLALQKSHRDFRLSMEDIARAYAAVHAADREGAFTMSSEFDAVRERIDYMRRHPDLRSLEPGVLEVAAQMSQTSRDLAATYSAERMDRARSFLRQRQEEIDDFGDQLTLARRTVDEIKRWSQQINVEGAVQSTQLAQLEADLLELLPDLGFDVEEEYRPAAEAKVVPIPAKPREAEPRKPRKPAFRDAGPGAVKRPDAAAGSASPAE